MLFVLWKFPSESSRVAPALLDPGGGQDRSSWPEVPELLKAGRGERRRSSPQAELQVCVMWDPCGSEGGCGAL